MPGASITRRFFFAQLAVWRAALAQPAVSSSDPLRNLRAEHPRLILPNSELPRIEALARDHPLAHRLFESLQREAEKIQNAPPLDYKFAGKRVLDRVLTLALLYRISLNPAFLERTVKELRASALFPNWNPQHFPDVAEMSCAFGVAFDWLYPALGETERDWIGQALVEKAIEPALAAYKEPAPWVTGNSDWNLVCNCGLAIGALAVAEREPDRARRLFSNAIEALPHGLSAFSPDGGWEEGPAYWNYSTRYVVSLLASLESALDNDLQLSATHGLDRTGRFRIYTTGPTNKTFNFADASEDPGAAPEMFWLARRFDQPVYAWNEQVESERINRADPMDLVWFYKDAKNPAAADWPTDALFMGAQVACLRTSWEDPAAIFLGVKGGDNKAPHSHLDLGSFVLDGGGVRWAFDPGPEDYSSPQSSGARRLPSFKTGTEEHNTIVIDGENQDRKAEARITRHEFGPDLSWVQIDLSRAYPAKLKQFQRRIGIAQKQGVLIADTLTADQPVDAVWGMLTQADVTVTGQIAQLTKNDWILECEIRSPHHAVFDVLELQGARKLVVRLGSKVTDLDLNLILIPYRASQVKPVITKRFPV